MREICLVIMLGLSVVVGSRDMEELQDFERMMAEPKDRSGYSCIELRFNLFGSF